MFNLFPGTTEKIFEMKKHLYDIYVDNQVVTTHSQILRELLKASDADRDKLQKLNNLRYASIRWQCVRECYHSI